MPTAVPANNYLQENLDKGLAYLERGVLSAARRGKVSKKTAEAVKTLLTPALSINAAKDCDMVSEHDGANRTGSKNKPWPFQLGVRRHGRPCAARVVGEG